MALCQCAAEVAGPLRAAAGEAAQQLRAGRRGGRGRPGQLRGVAAAAAARPGGGGPLGRQLRAVAPPAGG